jgi:putative transposase
MIAAKVKELRGMLYAVNGMADHVHLVVTLPPSRSLATFVGQIKGSSSHLGSRLEANPLFAWQSEYGVVSVSETHLSTVVRYVQQQQHHHTASTIDMRLENCG